MARRCAGFGVATDAGHRLHDLPAFHTRFGDALFVRCPEEAWPELLRDLVRPSSDEAHAPTVMRFAPAAPASSKGFVKGVLGPWPSLKMLTTFSAAGPTTGLAPAPKLYRAAALADFSGTAYAHGSAVDWRRASPINLWSPGLAALRSSLSAPQDCGYLACFVAALQTALSRALMNWKINFGGAAVCVDVVPNRAPRCWCRW